MSEVVHLRVIHEELYQSLLRQGLIPLEGSGMDHNEQSVVQVDEVNNSSTDNAVLERQVGSGDDPISEQNQPSESPTEDNAEPEESANNAGPSSTVEATSSTKANNCFPDEALKQLKQLETKWIDFGDYFRYMPPQKKK